MPSNTSETSNASVTKTLDFQLRSILQSEKHPQKSKGKAASEIPTLYPKGKVLK